MPPELRVCVALALLKVTVDKPAAKGVACVLVLAQLPPTAMDPAWPVKLMLPPVPEIVKSPVTLIMPAAAVEVIVPVFEKCDEAVIVPVPPVAKVMVPEFVKVPVTAVAFKYPAPLKVTFPLLVAPTFARLMVPVVRVWLAVPWDPKVPATERVYGPMAMTELAFGIIAFLTVTFPKNVYVTAE